MSCDDISRYSVSSQSGSKGSEAVSYYLDQDSGQFFSLLEGDGPPVPEYERGRNTGVRRRDKTPTHGETGVGGALPCVCVCVNVAAKEKHACLPPFIYLFFVLSSLLGSSLASHNSASFCFCTTCTLSSKKRKKKLHTCSTDQQSSNTPAPPALSVPPPPVSSLSEAASRTFFIFLRGFQGAADVQGQEHNTAVMPLCAIGYSIVKPLDCKRVIDLRWGPLESEFESKTTL